MQDDPKFRGFRTSTVAVVPGYELSQELTRHAPFVIHRARRLNDQRPVLIQTTERASAAETDALERHFLLLHGLALPHVPRPQELVRTPDRTCLVLDDAGFVPLGDLVTSGLELPAALRIACHLCTAVGELHRRRITHGAIGLPSVLVDPVRGDVQLLNTNLPFGFSTPGAGNPGAVYMSPEQTGRMNRSIDYRTDFYSIGATLYALLLGSPPFVSDDSLELIHAHIARTPTPAALVDRKIPLQLSRIIEKLLAKAAEDRYQSAHGLRHDLEVCRDRWLADHDIPLFELAQRDVPDRFVVSQKLYGRDREVAELLRAFEETCDGRTGLMLVTGYSGIGKTSLIRELYKPIVRERGYFVAGKFDQVGQGIPYGAFIQALRSLVWQLLTESEDRLDRWRREILQALGGNGGVLAEVLPEIELILGKQTAVPELDPTAARNRFEYVFQRFVGVLARREHPLVVFLDDLQWTDRATLDLWHALLTSADVRHLLLIGAYRDNEVDERHPLTLALDHLASAGARISTVSLGPLHVADLAAFLGDTFRRETRYLEPLARLIERKTDGNPFFVNQFLRTLDQEGLLTFDVEHGGWSFDLDAIAAAGITENVVELTTRKILRLSTAARQLLTTAACIGNQFDGATLRAISRQSSEVSASALAEVLEAGLIHEKAGSYAFLHDRVQQAAYALIPDAERIALHLAVGRLLLAQSGSEAGDDRLFSLVNHMNVGSELLEGAGERLRLARLNLAAGRKAKSSTAYQAALQYFDKGLSVIADQSWTGQYELLFALHLEAAESQYLSGAFGTAEQSFERLLQHAATRLDRAQIHRLRMTLYENQSRWTDAVAAGVDGLALFDLTLPQNAGDKQLELEREIETVNELVGSRTIASLLELPEMTDRDVRMIAKILTTLWAPVYILGDEVMARLISATIVRLSLQHGHTEDSAYGYVTHAITIGPIRRDYRAAYEWGLLALNVNRRFDDVTRRAKIYQQFQAHVNLWCRPFESCIPYAREASRSGFEAGDFPYAGYGAATEAWPAFLISQDLDQFVRDYTPTLAILDRVKMADFHGAHRAMLNWARALQGRTASRMSLSDDTFDEEVFVREHRDRGVFFLTFVYAPRVHLGVLHGEYERALVAMRQGRASAATGTIWPVLLDFWTGLAAAGAFDRAPAHERPGLRQQLAASRQSLNVLADTCPHNFRTMWLLVSAEEHRVDGEHEAAVAFCEEALETARQTGNVQHEALAAELSGRLWWRVGDVARARSLLGIARGCYARWGAAAKVAQLQEEFGELLAVVLPRSTGPASPAVIEPSASTALDMSTVLKVAHAVAVEIEIEGLLRTLMRLALENAGAERGAFVREHEGALVVEAEAGSDRSVRLPASPLDAADHLATSVVRYVHRTSQDVVVPDAARDERFEADEYVRRSRARSILCVPVAHQGRLRGILYLENNLTTHAFTPQHVEVMRILAAQTAISLENARLYRNMRDEVERRTAAEQALREALSEVQALKNRLEAENVYLQEEIRTEHNFNEIVGNSPALIEALRMVERVAPTDSTVLITGETGSGKELFARAIHSRSRRSTRPLVKVNCGAIAPGLVESELFGHVKGAFTGAIDKRTGRFELAHGGTIFLDEVGELPPEAQVKLLRVLQEQEFEPVGSSRTVQVNVRVIAATNRDLAHAVREGRFRADLLYRLNVFPIEVPPLRDRKPDISLLTGFFVSGLARKLGKPLQGVSAGSMQRLLEYSWPGNVRELQNVVERAAILAQGTIIDLDATMLGALAVGTQSAASAAGASHGLQTAATQSLQEIERLHILHVLQSTGGVVEGARGAATVLGMHPNTLRSRMKKLGIPTSRASS